MKKTQECISVDSRDPDSSFSNQLILVNESNSFKPPFPPLINIKDFVTKRSCEQKNPSRPPNAFIIYRKVCVNAAHAKNHCLPMTIISSLASELWKNEPPHVKNFYKNMAKDVSKHYSKMYPKFYQRKRREKWNLISFEKSNQDELENSNFTTKFPIIELKDSNEKSSENCEHEIQSIYPNPDLSFDINTYQIIREKSNKPSDKVTYPNPEANSFELPTFNTEITGIEKLIFENNSDYENYINTLTWYNNCTFSTPPTFFFNAVNNNTSGVLPFQNNLESDYSDSYFF
ncbi:7764_t:CDS:1 [Diversispora eburnea]|uniref:7764_t:CDS:1 n=1 Tax=Diversispora eburnea TaxID=1213867 RepID=A0A9N8YLU1_9GLOM|nr:7764_t:CDS:1 [Diversispora eburnea]